MTGSGQTSMGVMSEPRTIAIEREVILAVIFPDWRTSLAICLLLTITGFETEKNKNYMRGKISYSLIFFTEKYFSKIFHKSGVEDTEKKLESIL